LQPVIGLLRYILHLNPWKNTMLPLILYPFCNPTFNLYWYYDMIIFIKIS
jgi:hypothetical protein